MKRRGRRTAAVAAAISMTLAANCFAADIGDFLTGGAGGQTQDTSLYGTSTTGNDSSDYTGAESTGLSGVQTAAQSLHIETCTDSQTGINVARAVVPEGYSVSSETTWCGPVSSPDYPASVFIDAKSPDGSIELTYESPLEFVQVLNCYVNGMQFSVHQDWTVNTDYLMMMLSYMNAQQYCDYVSQNCMPGTSGMTFVSEKALTQENQAQLQQLSQQKLNEANQLLSASQQIYADYVETTAAERTYRYTDASGKSKILVIACAGDAVRLVEDLTSYGMGETSITNLIWTIPGRYCLMVDEDKYEEGMAVYESFCNNTTISDQFKQAMSELSQAIMQAVLNSNATSLSSQTSYVADTFSSELSSTDDTYSAIDAWDDVIMERNDYTLSSGDSVKVDTSYDYVYELDNGSVYATNSALDEPAGGTLLYAN